MQQCAEVQAPGAPAVPAVHEPPGRPSDPGGRPGRDSYGDEQRQRDRAARHDRDSHDRQHRSGGWRGRDADGDPRGRYSYGDRSHHGCGRAASHGRATGKRSWDGRATGNRSWRDDGGRSWPCDGLPARAWSPLMAVHRYPESKRRPRAAGPPSSPSSSSSSSSSPSPSPSRMSGVRDDAHQ
jgi:hypothetical protein